MKLFDGREREVAFGRNHALPVYVAMMNDAMRLCVGYRLLAVHNNEEPESGRRVWMNTCAHAMVNRYSRPVRRRRRLVTSQRRG